jgi:predicted GIY-YIG superfamily endonuclease
MVMKKWYVYELINTMGSVEYVGETTNPEERFYSHTKRQSVLKKDGKPNGHGKFYKRTDIFMNVVEEFNNKTDAWFFQCKLQKEWGLKSDAETNSEARKGNQFSKGNTFDHSNETKLKMSQIRKDWWNNKKQKQTQL